MSADRPAFRLSAVIVAWNSADVLGDAITSLRHSASSAEEPVEVIVVDNGSRDGSADAASAAGATVVLRNPVNGGFGVAALQGIARASGTWVALLNPDLVVDERFVAAVISAAESVPSDVATLVPDVRFASSPGTVSSRGLEVDAIGVPAEIQAGEPAAAVVPPQTVFGASSGACALRADALREVGGIEPAFFAYLEDVDLAWRLSCAGYRARFVADARAFHVGSASTGQRSWLKAYLVARNRRILFSLNGPHTVRSRAWRVVTEAAHAVVSTGMGTGSAPWRGRAAAFRLRPYVRYVRRSRRLAPRTASPALRPRVRLRAALRRKRSISGEAHHG